MTASPSAAISESGSALRTSPSGRGSPPTSSRKTGASLRSLTSMVTVVVASPTGLPLSATRIVSVNSAWASASRALLLATVISPVVSSISNAPLSLPSMMEKVSSSPVSSSVAEMMPTRVPTSEFSSIASVSMGSNTGVSFALATEMST